MPVNTTHSVFSPPPREAVIWRYMTLLKALDLFLTGKLYFASVAELREEDPLEGRSTNLTRRLLRQAASNVEMAREMFPVDGAKQSGEQAVKTAKLVLEQLDAASRIHNVSCWHESDHESAALWRLYSLQGEGIAIRATFGRLCEAMQSDLEIYAGRVSYQDYTATLTNQTNTFYSVMAKRHSFEHEKEVRFVADYRKLEVGVDPRPGVSVTASPASFVDEVIISPYLPAWSVNSVTRTLQLAGCTAPIRRSPLMEVE